MTNGQETKIISKKLLLGSLGMYKFEARKHKNL